MSYRRYPSNLTEAQKKMMRRVELGEFEPTPREEARLNRLVHRHKVLVRTENGWYRHANNLLPVQTYFIEEDYGNIKIGATPTPIKQLIDRLQLAHPRPLKTLGVFRGNRVAEFRQSCSQHHIKNGWYRPHADVLAWLQHKDFERA